MPAALGQEIGSLPTHVREMVVRARTSWLKSGEVYDVLNNYKLYRLPVGTEAPKCPGGGCLFLFNRKKVRFFRKDGHRWRKKAGGKTVRETHEKLKIDNKDALNCYYANAEAKEALQRRCYWLLEGDDDVVLVHYLSSGPAARIAGATTSSSATSRPADGGSALRGFGDSGALGSTSSLWLGLNSAGAASPLRLTITTGDFMVQPAANSHQGSSALPRTGSRRFALCQEGHAPCAPPETSEMPVATVSMPPSDAKDRANSIDASHTRRRDTVRVQPRPAGPLHSAPSFLGGTVQTGPTLHCLTRQQRVLRQGSRHSTASAAFGSRVCSEAGGPATRPVSCVIHIPPPSNRADGRAGSKLQESQERPESGAVDADHFDLKPAISLTRVDSDTLKVAPSLSGATAAITSSAFHADAAAGKQAPPPERPSLPSSVFSPFYAAAFLGQPIGTNVLQQSLPQAPGQSPFADDPDWASVRQPPSTAKRPFGTGRHGGECVCGAGMCMPSVSGAVELSHLVIGQATGMSAPVGAPDESLDRPRCTSYH